MRRIAAALLFSLLSLTAAFSAPKYQSLDVLNVPSLGNVPRGIKFQSFPLSLSARGVFIGDSITAARGFAGYTDWALLEMDGRFYPKTVGSNGTGPTGWNQGVSGNTCDQVIARLSNVTAEAPRFVLFACGTNDIGTGAQTSTQICADYDTIIAHGRSIGARVFAMTVIPRSSAGWLAAQETARGEVNTCLKAKLPGAVFDADTVITNTATQLLADGTHPNGVGAQLLGTGIATMLLNSFTTESLLPTSAPSAPANLFANPFFSGGTTVATSWTFFQGVNGLTKAASKTTVDGFTAQRYVASGTASANVADNFNQNVTVTGGLTGDLVEAWVEVVVTTATGISGISISAGTNGTNTTHMSITAQDLSALTVPFRGVLRAPPSTLASDAPVLNPRLSIIPSNGAVVNADITFLRANYRIVPSGQ